MIREEYHFDVVNAKKELIFMTQGCDHFLLNLCIPQDINVMDASHSSAKGTTFTCVNYHMGLKIQPKL